jgi:hypothetical protein
MIYPFSYNLKFGSVPTQRVKGGNMHPVNNQLNAPTTQDNTNPPPIPQRRPNARRRVSPAITHTVTQLGASLARRNAPGRDLWQHTPDNTANPHLQDFRQRRFALVPAAVPPTTNNA